MWNEESFSISSIEYSIKYVGIFCCYAEKGYDYVIIKVYSYC